MKRQSLLLISTGSIVPGGGNRAGAARSAAEGPRPKRLPMAAGESGGSSETVLLSLNALLGRALAEDEAQQAAEKAALDDFLLLHARRYDFSNGNGVAEAFGGTFALLVAERFLSPTNWGRMSSADFKLRVLQCMRVLMRDAAHRRAFASTRGAVSRLCELCVELCNEHFGSPGVDFTSEMLVETLSILKRFANLPELRSATHASPAGTPSASGAPSVSASGTPSLSTSPRGAKRQLFPGEQYDAQPSANIAPSVPSAPPECGTPCDGPAAVSSLLGSPNVAHDISTTMASTHASQGLSVTAGLAAPLGEVPGTPLEAVTPIPSPLHGALVALLSTREALVLQCVLVALFQFVQVYSLRQGCSVEASRKPCLPRDRAKEAQQPHDGIPLRARRFEHLPVPNAATSRHRVASSCYLRHQVEYHRLAIGSSGCAEILLRILSDYEPSFKVWVMELLAF